VRATDNVVFTIRNATDGIEAIFGTCTIGDLSTLETPANHALPAIAIVRDPHLVADGTNATQYESDAAYDALDAYDTIIIEGNLTQGTARSSVQIARDLAAAAQHGITVLIIGDPGTTVLGVSVNRSNATSVTVTGAQAALIGLPLGLVNLSGGAPVPIPTIIPPTASETDNWEILGTTDSGAVAIATWTYEDARVFYVATSTGTLANSTTLVDALRAGAKSRIIVSWPQCAEATLPADATAIARYDRALAYHDKILTLRVIVWRDY
jgi:hypothetical protein